MFAVGSLPVYAKGQQTKPELLSFRVQLETGIDMHYVAKGPLNKNKQAFILLHGYSDSWRSFDEILKSLPVDELGIPVYALDMRGHGESSESVPSSYTQGDFTNDVAAFMKSLKIKKAIIVGHSMGSLIAHKFAIDYPNKVWGLVLLGSTTTMANHPVTLELKSIIDAFDDNQPADPAFVVEFQTSTFYTPIIWAIYRYVSESLRLNGRVWKQTLGGLNTEDHTNQLPLIAVPTLILWGEQDTVFSKPEQLNLDRLIPDSTLITYPNTGHAVNVERADEVVKDMKEFIKQLK
jgi:pimeloyl-ACP methyl ester carboxylesterase